MNLSRLYPILFILLLACTIESNGIIISLLIKLIALKGALFLGTPIALGSFFLGQGVGFFAGKMTGGWAVMKTAQKYHEKEKAKWKAPSYSSSSYKGWGWDGDKGHGHLYGKGYKKGYGVGSAIGAFLDKHKHKGHQHSHGWTDYDYTSYDEKPPIVHHYYGGGGWSSPSTHGHGGGWSSPSTYGHGGGWSSPSTHGHGGGWSSPSMHGHGGGGYGYGSPSYGYGSKSPSMMEKIIGKIPGVSTLFSSDKGAGSSYSYTAGGSPPYYNDQDSYAYTVPSSDYHGYEEPPPPPQSHGDDGNPYDAPSAYSFSGQDPMNTYQPGIFSSPPKSSRPAGPGPSSYTASIYEQGSPSSTAFDYYKESSPSHGSSKYAAPLEDEEDKYLPIGSDGIEDRYPGGSPTYDGPGKQYTGVMTDIYEKFKASKPKSYGKPMAKPMGPEEYYSSSEENPLYDLFERSKLKNQNRPESSSEESIRSTKTVSAPNHVLEKFLEAKLEQEAAKAKDDETRKEARELITLLRQVYMVQLAQSMKTDGGPAPGDFVPFPTSVPNSTTNKPTIGTTTVRVPTSTTQRYVSTIRESTPRSTTRANTPTSTTLAPTPRSTQRPPLTTTEAAKFVHYSTASWLPRVVPDFPIFPEATSSRHKRAGKLGEAAEVKGDQAQLNLDSEQVLQLRLLYTFMEEIKQFFTLVSILDQDTCLQKMVCDVHASTAAGQEAPKLSVYESNLITTFKIMDTLMPMDATATEDSSTKYRLAAKIGETSGSSETCAKYYTSCGYSSNQIISLGNQVEAAQGQESSNVPVTIKEAPAAQPAAAQSMSMSVSSFSSTASVTAMPRV